MNKITELDAYKHRVKVLETAISQFADSNNWYEEPGLLQWMGKRNAIDYAKEILVTGCVGD
jgi:hypothetical protein